eukprot:161834-Rhodomonas_salina.2
MECAPCLCAPAASCAAMVPNAHINSTNVSINRSTASINRGNTSIKRGAGQTWVAAHVSVLARGTHEGRPRILAVQIYSVSTSIAHAFWRYKPTVSVLASLWVSAYAGTRIYADGDFRTGLSVPGA